MKRTKTLALLLALALALAAVPALAAGDALLTRGEFLLGLFQVSDVEEMEPRQAYFEDVPMHGDLALAVRWAVGEGVVKGYGDGRFGPDDPVNREQMVTMLYRSAQARGLGFQGLWMFPLAFPDADQVSDWASEAMHWAVMHKIIIGTDRGLEPKAFATDEQLSLVLERWQRVLSSAAPAILVRIDVEGQGDVGYAEGETAPERHPDQLLPSAQIRLAESATYTFAAWPKAGNRFVKWTKNGEDFSTEMEITLLLDQSADYVAVFEEDPDWQNPVMNFVGEYQCDRANALVECSGYDSARITIEWGGSAWELARWVIVGPLDTDTLRVDYADCVKTVVTYDDSGALASEATEYENGTGSITFGQGLSFTWHEDQADRADMLFQWLPVAEG